MYYVNKGKYEIEKPFGILSQLGIVILLFNSWGFSLSPVYLCALFVLVLIGFAVIGYFVVLFGVAKIENTISNSQNVEIQRLLKRRKS